MEFDILLNAVVLLIYGTVCIISIIFTFSIDTYSKISERLSSEIISGRVIVDFLEKNIDWLDNWLVNNNKIAGPILILLSIVDLKLWLDIIKLFEIK